MAALAVVVCAGAYSWWAAGTTPFTAEADLATAVAFGAIAALMIGVWFRGASAGALHPAHDATARPSGRLAAWATALTILAVWEVVTYLAGLGARREQFPTLSSLYDSAVRHRSVKAALFFSWLVLGLGLFAR